MANVNRGLRLDDSVCDDAESSEFDDRTLVADSEPPLGGPTAPGPGRLPLFEVAARVAAEMAEAWGRGECLSAEDMLYRYPALLEQPAAALWVVIEEMRLRREDGSIAATDDFILRFPYWARELARLREMEYQDAPIAASCSRPVPGQALGDFHLHAVLGRGARGEIFLATQPALGDRPVVLKVSARDGGEHLALARLQHAHIVPLLWAQDLPDPGVSVLCMPYLGGATLQRLLAMLAATPPRRRSGRALLAALDQARAEAPLDVPSRSTARTFLEHASYPEAIAWIGACLADALHHAHGRDLIHLDVKPGNLLIGSDGVPMLLDFHLARRSVASEDVPAAPIGGTVAYMAPEQRVAVVAAQSDLPVSVPLDGRVDLYSLGVTLFEALVGDFPSGMEGRWGRRLKKAGVPPALASIVARLLAYRPDDRYASAGQLAEDLRAYLAASSRRRGRARTSWRRPVLSSVAALVLLAGGLIGASGVGLRISEADSALNAARVFLDRGSFDEAERRLKAGLARLDELRIVESMVPRVRILRARFSDFQKQARVVREASAVHQVAERLRFQYGAESPTPDVARALETSLRDVQELGMSLLDPEGPRALQPEAREQLQDDLRALAVVAAELPAGRSSPDVGSGQDAARHRLAGLERRFGSDPILAHEILTLAGKPEEARRAIEGWSPRTAWEAHLLGIWLLRAGDLEEAVRSFDRAIETHPEALGPRFQHGVCNLKLGRDAEALADFEVCVALAPDSPACYRNRASAEARLGLEDRASRDRDRASAIETSARSVAMESQTLP